MHTQTIVLIGYGYWGKVLENILISLGYRLDAIISTNRNYLSSESHPFSLHYSENELKALTNASNIIVATGPTFHHEVLEYLYSNHKSFEGCRIWLEKPVFITGGQLSSRLFGMENIFVDYPYASENSRLSEFLHDDASFYEISLFSSNVYRRAYPIIFDFTPHLFALMGFCNQDFKLNKYLYEVVYCHGGAVADMLEEFYGSISISSSNGKHFVLNYGINKNGRTSSITARHDRERLLDRGENIKLSCVSGECLKHHHLLTDLFLRPVDQNLTRFLSAENNFTGTLFSSIEFHRRIYHLTVEALSKI